MNFKKLKIFLSVLLCLAMVLSLTSIAGFSALADDGDGGENVEIPHITESEWDISVPQIYIYTEEGNGLSLLKADGYVNSEVTIKDVDGTTLTDAASFKVRGNTTSLYWIDKKPFTFKFNKKKNVLGLGSGKKWALIANAFDPTLLRNRVAFDLAKQLGLEYTSNQRFVELWVDGSYRGLYALYEPVEEGKDRVNIDIEGNDGKKDFMIEYEAMREEEDVTYFKVDGLRFIASEPDEPDEEQLAYIQSTMDDIVKTMKSGTRAQIEEKIDVESFVKFYVLNEYLKTFDFSVSSVNFYYKDGKLYAGPPWDYDLSGGNNAPEYSARAADADKTDGLFAAGKNLYLYLIKKGWFYAQVRDVYSQNADYIASISADGGLLDTLRAQYATEIDRNYTVYSVSKHWINNQKKPLPTYDENYDYLKNWYKERHIWLGEYLSALPDPYIKGDANGDGKVNISDATLLQRVLADSKVEDSDNVIMRGKVMTGALSVKDVTELQRYVAEYDNLYHIGDYA